MKSSNVSTLNIAQERAVRSEAETIACIAGPGSGKTTVLTKRIRHLTDHGADPRKMVAITFTNSGAKNLVDKLGPWFLEPIFGDTTDNWLQFPMGFCGTLHGFALRMLKKHGAGIGYGERTAIIDEGASADLLMSKAQTLGCKAKLEDLLKIKAAGRPGLTGRLGVPETVVACYLDDLRGSGILDFDRILSEFRRMLTFNEDKVGEQIYCGEFTHLFVDEVQDSGSVDWEIYRMLPIKNKFLVGDPDQAIYGFRGGRVDELIHFCARPGVETIYLEANYRSTVSVCEAASVLISHNQKRIKKWTNSASGEMGCEPCYMTAMTPGEEVAWVGRQINGFADDGMLASDIAVLARTNSIAKTFRDGLRAAGIPVVDPPKTEQAPDAALARALVEFLVQPDNDTLAFFYVLARECRFTSPALARKKAHDCRREAAAAGKSMNRLWFGFSTHTSLAEVPRLLKREGVTLEAEMAVADKIRTLPLGSGLEDLALALAGGGEAPAEGEKEPGVTVTTAHDAKGREWEAVFVVGLEEEVWRCGKKDEGVEEERRLAFVSITRAKRHLFLSSSETREATWGDKRMEPHTPSRFLKEVVS